MELNGMKMFAMIVGSVFALCCGLSSAQTISPRRLVEVADLSAPVVSPDGRQVAFRIEQASIERNTYDSAWYVQRMDGGAPPRRVGDGGVPLRNSAGTPLAAAAVWSSDGRYLYYRALLDGRVDVWRAAADGSGAEALALDAADVRDFSLSDDGKALRYSVGATREEVVRAEQDEYDRGIRIDDSVPVGAGLFRSSFFGGRLATQRYTGSWFERGPLLREVPDRWREIELDTRERRELSSSDVEPERSAQDIVSEGAPTPSQVERDPRSGRLALLTPVDQGRGTLATDHVELSVLSGSERAPKVIKCQAEPCARKRITGVQWRPDGDEVLFTVTDRRQGLAQSIFRWNVETGAVMSVVQSRGLVTGGRDHYVGACGVSTEALACVAAEADRPPRLERIDIESGQRLVLFEPNAALAADMADRISSRLLRWEDEDGQEFTGQLFMARNRDGSKGPLFVTYYLCTGFLRGGLGDEWPLASLAEAGITALCINHRYRPDPIGRYEAGRSAVASAVEWLASEGLVDPARVGMGGLSFGSEVTLWIAMESDLLAAASVTSPSISPLYYLVNSLKGETFFPSLRRSWGLGSPDETPEQWRRVSPIHNIDRIQAPLLFQMPEEEYIHTLDYVIPLMRNQQADLYVFPHAPHQKFQPRHKLAAYERNLDWFRFWLQGVEDHTHGKAEQYEHWHLMRERPGRDDAGS